MAATAVAATFDAAVAAMAAPTAKDGGSAGSAPKALNQAHG